MLSVLPLPGRHPQQPGGERDSTETLDEVLARLRASPSGLDTGEAARRLESLGPNRLREDDGNHPLSIFFRQFSSPMVLILLAAALLAFLLQQTDEAIIVAIIVVASSGLGFYQEYQAGHAVAELRRRIAVSSDVLRDGQAKSIPAAEIVPGDVLVLSAGSLVSADAVLLDAVDLHIDEAALTGESFPAAKLAANRAGALSKDNRVHMGTSVRSGQGRALVVATGVRTDFGGLASAVGAAPPETAFSRGIRRFGLLMTQIMVVLVTVVLAANVLLGRPVLDSLLFAAALAVGITPELLPAIVSVTLAQGSRQLASKGVLVRRLVAIENLGTMTVLCTDKTGTLTVGSVALFSAVDANGRKAPAVLRWAVANASLQSAPPNPLDEAILAGRAEVSIDGCARLAEIPYDFERKRLSVLVTDAGLVTLVCKGAVSSVLSACTMVAGAGGPETLSDARRAAELQRLEQWSSEGLRVLAVALREMPSADTCDVSAEAQMTLVGYLLFADPLKPNILATVGRLRDNGIALKIISGDNRYVAGHVASALGLDAGSIVSGDDLDGLSGVSFARRVLGASVFAEITPDLKERIIAALRATGVTVGYMGDGINDAPALRGADIGISVDNAVDAAKAAADVILLRQDLDVLLDGVIAGRTSFGNTIKYIGITLSANFGNMISMATASVLLPFLPMLATQILLNNLLADLPMLAISTDKVDTELLRSPRQWNFRALIRAMIGFGLLSSVFDALTFVTLLVVFHASPQLAQTGWFTESLLTELAVVAAMRTSRPLLRSQPSPVMLAAAALVAVAAIALPYLPLDGYFNFVPMPPLLLASIVAIVAAYVIATELLKRRISVLEPLPATADGRAPNRYRRWLGRE